MATEFHPYPCPRCEFGFDNFEALATHMHYRHDAEPVKLPPYPEPTTGMTEAEAEILGMFYKPPPQCENSACNLVAEVILKWPCKCHSLQCSEHLMQFVEACQSVDESDPRTIFPCPFGGTHNLTVFEAVSL